MKLTDWGLFAVVLMILLSWQEEKKADRCFEAAKLHVELAECKP